MPRRWTACRREHRRLRFSAVTACYFFGYRQANGPLNGRAQPADRRIVDDVNVAAIPLLERPFRVVDTSEVMLGGDAPKNLVVLGSDPRNIYDYAYIAKKPRCEGVTECATEYLIARLAATLPVAVAEARLARVSVDDVRFMSRRFTRANTRLVHGVEIVARALNVEPRDVEDEVPKNRQRHFYTVDTLVDVLTTVFPNEPSRTSILRGFGRMLAFDALIGCQDRHPMNWGVVEDAQGLAEPYFAPLFDAARGLFWNHTDAQLATKSSATGGGRGDPRRAFLNAYADRCLALICRPSFKTSSHFELIEHILSMPNPILGQEVRRVVNAFRPELARHVLEEQFAALLSNERRRLVEDLLHIRHDRLRGLCGR